MNHLREINQNNVHVATSLKIASAHYCLKTVNVKNLTSSVIVSVTSLHKSNYSVEKSLIKLNYTDWNNIILTACLRQES